MPTYPFLSDTWIEETRRLRHEHRSKAQPSVGGSAPLRMNQIVTDVPFDPGTIHSHFDTSSGEPELDLGHLEGAEITVTVSYDVAKKIFVDGNVGAALEAFQLGRIKVEGDMMKLMALAGVTADPGTLELAKQIRDITE